MTVATEAYLGQVTWTGQTTINPGFSAERVTDVHVSATAPNGVVTELIQGTQYTVTLGANSAVTINIIVGAMPPQPQTLTAFRDTPALQEVDFQDLQDFSADDHEKLHDRWARIFAEHNGEFARSLRVPPGEVVAVLPPASVRAGKVLGFDQVTGAPIMALSTDSVIGGGAFFIFNDPDNGLIARPITSDDLPAAQINGLGGVKAIVPVAGKALVGLDEGGAFLLGDVGLGAIELVSGSGGAQYNVLRAPGDPSDATLRRVYAGNAADPEVILRASGMVFTDPTGALVFGSMTGTGLHGWTINVDPAAPGHNTITGLQTSMFAAGQMRELLQANRTYFVRKTGLDTNDGRTAATAFLTIQKAIDVAVSLDLNIFAITIDIGAGTYTTRAAPGAGEESPIFLKSYIGTGPISLMGAGPGSTIIHAFSTGINCNNVLGRWTVHNMKIEIDPAAGGFHCILVSGGSALQMGSPTTTFEVGNAGNAHFAISDNARLTVAGNYIVSGNAGFAHWSVTTNGTFGCGGKIITINNSPSVGTWAYCTQSAVMVVNANTYTNKNTVTGQKFGVDRNGTIDLQLPPPADVTVLPGSTAGFADTATGGVYS